MHLYSVGQVFCDFSELRDIAVGFLIVANPIMRIDQMKVNKVATKRILPLRRKFVRKRIRY